MRYRKRKNADGDVFNVTEANTEESTSGKIPEGLSGSENVACMERSARNLGGILLLLLKSR
jgi:hypothetical protein